MEVCAPGGAQNWPCSPCAVLRPLTLARSDSALCVVGFVLQLKKQAEITAAQQAAIEAKERAEAERRAKRQAELAEV